MEKKQNEYMHSWREKNKEKIKEINRRYYIRNKGYLNKTRSRPWTDDNILRWIRRGDAEYLNMMLRILRPYKDKLIGLD